ncbi:MAG: hypothetical protein K2H01_10165 [Ruminococcus sp.]|nr:hypothetical protein [Ruminococcus sp.]
MGESFIPVSEFETATNAVNGILGQPVEEIKITDVLPPLNEITDSNKVFKGKLSVLFVDMRKSTDLTDEIKSKKMVKVYRSFIRMAIQAIRYSGGYTRQFAGDGIMGIFQDSNEDEQIIASSQKAVQAARYIHTLIDYCLNPALKKTMGICIGCGVGICTGTVMITKVGMRGKEGDEKAENETGAVWVGSTTNYASRYCSLATPCEIFIDENTYSEIWVKTSRTKGNKIFEGYTAREYYLALPEGVTTEAVKTDEQHNSEATFIQEIFSETKEKSLLLVDEISKKFAELAVALENIKQRENQVLARDNDSRKESIRLQQWQSRLDSKQADVDRKEQKNKEQAYSIHRSIFSETHCKSGIIKEFGKDYWLELIQKMYELGEEIGKSKLQVEIDLDCYLVGIYMCFNMYEEAYEVFCVQAEHSSWLHTHTLEDVVKQSGHWAKLKGILEKRVCEGKDYRECLDKLKSMGY